MSNAALKHQRTPNAEGIRRVNPWIELKEERAAHRETLRRLAEIEKRIHIRDGTGRTAGKICKLCVEVPMGVHPGAWRGKCPGHVQAYCAQQQARIAVIIEPINKANHGRKVPWPPPPIEEPIPPQATSTETIP